MTFRECIIKTRKLINYYSIEGSIIADYDETQRDFTARAAAAIDTAQKELAAVCPLVRHMHYIQRPVRVLAVHPQTFTLDGDFVICANGAGAFSFSADGDVQAVMEIWENDSWRELLAVGDVSDGEVKTVSGELDTVPAEDARIRITVSGSGVDISSLALYRSFPRHEDPPLYRTPRTRPLPPNFYRAALVSAQPFRDRVRRSAFYTVDNGKISFPWEFYGKVDLAYEIYPRTVDEETADGFVLDLPDNAAEVIPYFAASMLLTDDDPSMSQFFLKMYNERYNALTRPGAQSVVNTMWRQ